MVDLIKSLKIGKAKKDYLNEIAKIAQEEREKILRERIREIVAEEIKNSGIDKRIDEIFELTKNLEKNLENLKNSLVPLSRSKTDSIRKIKIKRMIIELLTKNKRMTAVELSAKLDLSRTRCSEYLSEMEKDGILKGTIISRQKFYELNQ
ncbi:MAG: winged helix-turn-helix domain-containing protein [Candidatus Aenigmatarchaeota archaeon]